MHSCTVPPENSVDLFIFSVQEDKENSQEAEKRDDDEVISILRVRHCFPCIMTLQVEIRVQMVRLLLHPDCSQFLQ